jgi:EAL domain-containing protein (putative c-di-GMP-specific phosphodiesterase class I)
MADANSKRLPVRVVVVDDHEMILQSVVRLLTADSKIDVVGTALTGADGIEVASQLKPDVVVIDYHLPDMDAPEAIKLLHAQLPDVKIVTISGNDRPGSFYDSARAGSMAWVRKTRAIQELRVAIMSVASGETYINDEMAIQPNLDDLVVHYQPVVALKDGRIAGFEALVRWQHPERGLLFPDAFLPNAVDSGFVQEIDQWVLGQAARQLRTWRDTFPKLQGLFVSVNMSQGSVANPQLRDSIQREINDANIDPHDVIVEVKESVLVESPEEIMGLLSHLNEVGIRLALEDFGASFSTISYIHRAPFDCVKIARSFTRELPTSTGTLWLIEGIKKVTDTMKSMCVATGIENIDQFQTLQEAGVEFGQGFLFSAAVKPAVCDTLLGQPSLAPSMMLLLETNAVNRDDRK